MTCSLVYARRGGLSWHVRCCCSCAIVVLQEAALAGSSSPQALVSDIRVLDALLGNALRKTDAFLASRVHWADKKDTTQEGGQQRFHPVVIGQTLGPHLGNALHCMWTANARSAPPCAVQVCCVWHLCWLGSCSSSVRDAPG